VDLNQLYSDHQALLMRAERAPSEGFRHVHQLAASHIAGRIGCMQRALGAAAAPSWDNLARLGERSLASPVRHQQGHAA
jgi:hypothetical protein